MNKGLNQTYFSRVWQHFTSSINTDVVINKLISVVLTLLVMWIASKVLTFIIKRAFKITKNSRFTNTEEDEKRNMTIAKITRSTVNTTIAIVGILVILSYFINISALITVAGVGTVAVGFGAKRIVEDVLSGIFIIMQGEFFVGDYIELDGDHSGVIEDISTMMTSIRQYDGSLYIVRNGEINHLVNCSRGYIRNSIDLQVDGSASVVKVTEIANTVCDIVYQKDSDIFPVRPKVLGMTAMDGSYATLRVYVFSDAGHALSAQVTMRQALYQAMEEADIKIPRNTVWVANEKEDQNKGAGHDRYAV
ncbi:MAG: mechanosensitive ion channel family protein [Pseudoramibacter sp.]